jgi:hypothetical protein
MAIVRHLATNAVRLGKAKRSIKFTHELAGWNPTSSLAINLDPAPYRTTATL